METWGHSAFEVVLNLVFSLPERVYNIFDMKISGNKIRAVSGGGLKNRRSHRNMNYPCYDVPNNRTDLM